MDEEPGRFRVEFAPGTAASVTKRPSYRDHQRSDMDGDLPGWPPGRVFAIRGVFGRLGRYVPGVVTTIPILPPHIIANALGSPP